MAVGGALRRSERSPHPRGLTPRADIRRRLTVTSRRVKGGVVLAHDREGRPMNGWLMWGAILPLLLVVAGIITIRRRNHRR